jgi:hemerythrin
MPADSIAQHVAAHQAILVDYTELNMDLMDHHPVVRSEVLFRMERWIQDHIMEYDLKLRDYLPSRPLLAP